MQINVVCQPQHPWCCMAMVSLLVIEENRGVCKGKYALFLAHA